MAETLNSGAYYSYEFRGERYKGPNRTFGPKNDQTLDPALYSGRLFPETVITEAQSSLAQKKGGSLAVMILGLAGCGLSLIKNDVTIGNIGLITSVFGTYMLAQTLEIENRQAQNPSSK